MSYPRTHVDHRNPDHHESMHPTRNIVNAHVVAGESLTPRYHDRSKLFSILLTNLWTPKTNMRSTILAASTLLVP